MILINLEAVDRPKYEILIGIEIIKEKNKYCKYKYCKWNQNNICGSALMHWRKRIVTNKKDRIQRYCILYDEMKIICE